MHRIGINVFLVFLATTLEQNVFASTSPSENAALASGLGKLRDSKLTFRRSDAEPNKNPSSSYLNEEKLSSAYLDEEYASRMPYSVNKCARPSNRNRVSWIYYDKMD